MSRVFLSYSREDEESARTAKSALARHGLDVWLAADEIRSGERVADRIRDELQASTAVILLIGQHPSNWARSEWGLALGRSWDDDRGVNLLPVLLPGADPPAFLQNLHHLRILDEARDWDRVADMLTTSPTGALRWRSSDAARTALARRLTALEKVAATLPHAPFEDAV